MLKIDIRLSIIYRIIDTLFPAPIMNHIKTSKSGYLFWSSQSYSQRTELIEKKKTNHSKLAHIYLQNVFPIDTGEAAEVTDLELQDLKEPVRMNIKTEATIFLTLTATFFSLGFWGCAKLLSKEDSL